jgi:hypothetical protein
MQKIQFDMSRYTTPKTKATSERGELLEKFVKRLQANSGAYRPMSKARICMYMAYIDTDDLDYFYKKLCEAKNFGSLWSWYCIASDLNK